MVLTCGRQCITSQLNIVYVVDHWIRGTSFNMAHKICMEIQNCNTRRRKFRCHFATDLTSSNYLSPNIGDNWKKYGLNAAWNHQAVNEKLSHGGEFIFSSWERSNCTWDLRCLMIVYTRRIGVVCQFTGMIQQCRFVNIQHIQPQFKSLFFMLGLVKKCIKSNALLSTYMVTTQERGCMEAENFKR